MFWFSDHALGSFDFNTVNAPILRYVFILSLPHKFSIQFQSIIHCSSIVPFFDAVVALSFGNQNMSNDDETNKTLKCMTNAYELKMKRI